MVSILIIHSYHKNIEISIVWNKSFKRYVIDYVHMGMVEPVTADHVTKRLVTSEPFIMCSNCSKKTSYYYDGFKKRICVNCLVNEHGGEFPKGKGVELPCKKCEAPNIRWYHMATYGEISRDCGNHRSKLNEQSDDDPIFEWD